MSIRDGIERGARPSSRPVSAVRLSDVAKVYGAGDVAVHALRGVTLEVPAGQFVVILGPSGSGKTTLMNLVGGMEPPSRGTIEVAGRQLAGLDDDALTAYRRDVVGFVFQFFNLVPTLTALENVQLVAELVGKAGPEASADALRAVGLDSRADHFPSALSGGEQQRVAIARAVVKDPELLLCDEPTGSLDLETGRQVLGVLHRLSRVGGRTVLLVTHNAAIATIADLVVRMRSGEIVEVRTITNPVAPDDISLVRLLRRSLRRDLAARRAQFLAIGATILLGVTLFGASYDAFENLTASYQRLYDSLDFADLTISGGSPEAVAGRLAGEPDVQAVATRKVADVPIDVRGRRFVGRAIGMPATGEPNVNRVTVLRGAALDPTRADGVLVEQHMAATFQLEPGDAIRILGPEGWRPATVLGVVASPEYLWPARSRQEVLVPVDEFGVVFALDSFVAASPAGTTHAETLVRLSTGAPDGTLDHLATLAIAAGASSTTTLADQASNATLQEDVSGFGELSLAFPLLFLGAGALAMSVLLGRMVATHRSQIGVLRASGFGRRTILVHYLGFGLLVGLAGSIPGAILGGLAAAAITGVYTAVLSIPTSVVEARPATVVIGVLIGPAAGALAALAPARRAAATSPAEAMRGSGPIGRGSASLAERLVPPLRRLPTRWLVSLRGLGRSRRRSLTTVVGIALATSLIFVSWAMVDTVQILLDRQFVRIQREDATVVLATPVAATAVADAINVNGVARVEPELVVPATIVGGSGRYATSLIGLLPATTMRGLVDRDGHPLPLDAGGILLGAALEAKLGLAVGDTVAVETSAISGTDGDAAHRASLMVSGFVEEPLGTYAYGDLATVAAGAGLAASDPAVTTALVQYAAGMDRRTVRDALAALPGVAAVVDSRALYDAAQSFMGLFYAFVGVMLVLGGIMAFALIFNTLSANVTERAVELTALRTQGMDRATIGRLITAENVLLTVVALVPGLLVAYVAAAGFMASFSSDLFRFNLAVRPTTFIGTAAVILLVALLSQWPSLRAVGRLDLGRVVRERAT